MPHCISTPRWWSSSRPATAWLAPLSRPAVGGARFALGAGVLLAAGGFENNPALRKRFGVPGDARDTMGAPANIGLALEAGIAAGAAVDLMDQAWWSPGFTHPDGRSAFSLWFTGGIFVNEDGRRFRQRIGTI